jgi:hypothetical protein
MRKATAFTLGIVAVALAGSMTADAAVKAYWDQATGRWMKFDTNARRVSPVAPGSGATTSMGKQIRLLSGANNQHSGGATRVLTQLKSIRAVSERNTQSVRQTRGSTGELVSQASGMKVWWTRLAPSRTNLGHG